MTRTRKRVAGLGLALGLLLAGGTPSRAHADEPWLLTLELDGAVPLSRPQRDWFRPGGAGAVTLWRFVHPAVGLGLRVRGGWLSDGPAPRDLGLKDPGVGGLGTLGAMLRWRPITRTEDPRRGTGLFVDVGGGGALTGGLVRGSVEAGLGWGFEVGSVDLAPVVRYLRVFQPNGDQLDTRDAQILLVGLELTLFDPRGGGVPLPERETPERPTPSNDRDGDGIADSDDACPDEPEDFDEFEDTDGCPDLDDDRDGILDVSDACRLEPEDVDGFADEDGCPDPDNDEDGILDRDDACPNEPEVVNGVDDQDGCPDEGLIQLLDDRIVLEERVLFDFERARVKHAARPVLDAIVELVRQHPEWALMRVDGHADVRGDADFNRRLSERRARNVMRALTERGLAAERLEFRGFGSERPRDHRRTEEAHQRNRRVEFVIVARRGADGALQRTEVRDETDASLD
ncbi:MAG: OmpA family protein [Sandaracinus sp.]|nr:OmpA family protein [Sandaracinus sp.]